MDWKSTTSYVVCSCHAVGIFYFIWSLLLTYFGATNETWKTKRSCEEPRIILHLLVFETRTDEDHGNIHLYRNNTKALSQEPENRYLLYITGPVTLCSYYERSLMLATNASSIELVHPTKPPKPTNPYGHVCSYVGFYLIHLLNSPKEHL